MSFLLGLDIGTTSTIGILIDCRGSVLAIASRPSELLSRRANWAEEDPDQWWANVCAIVPELISAGGIRADDIAGVGVTGMVPALILLDDDGLAIRHSIQQNDARAIDEIAAMARDVDADVFLARTGGSINQQIIAPKLRWLERHEPGNRDRMHAITGSYSYITSRLCGVLTIERNWALEAGFMDLASGSLDDGLLAHAGLRSDNLPPLHASHDVVGEVTADAAYQTGLAIGTPVVAGCADHIASAFVAGASRDGDLVVKYGGAGDILLSCTNPVTDPRMFIDYHIVPGLHFSNGCMAASGSVLNWIAAHLAKAEEKQAAQEGRSVHAFLDAMAADLPPGAGGVLMLPYFLGEKTPLNDPHARGTLTGLGLHHGLAHVWRAALESVVFGFRHHVDVFDDMGLEVARVVACDGGAASDVWVQITADVLERPIERMIDHPGSGLGAAFVAGIGVGVVDDWADINAYVGADRVFEPNGEASSVYREAYDLYRELYESLKALYPRVGRLPAA